MVTFSINDINRFFYFYLIKYSSVLEQDELVLRLSKCDVSSNKSALVLSKAPLLILIV